VLSVKNKMQIQVQNCVNVYWFLSKVLSVVILSGAPGTVSDGVA